jgi:hypothetical protein
MCVLNQNEKGVATASLLEACVCFRESVLAIKPRWVCNDGSIESLEVMIAFHRECSLDWGR